MELDKYAPFLLTAFGITWLVLLMYLGYIWTRRRALERALMAPPDDESNFAQP